MKLPEEIIFNNRKYIKEITHSKHVDFYGCVFISYVPETDIVETATEDNLPIYVHDKHNWYYLTSFGTNWNNNALEEAEKDMIERLEGAREFYPDIDEAIKKYNYEME